MSAFMKATFSLSSRVTEFHAKSVYIISPCSPSSFNVQLVFANKTFHTGHFAMVGGQLHL